MAAGAVFSDSVNKMGSIHSFNKVTKMIIREISESVGTITGATSNEQKNQLTEGLDSDQMTFFSVKM